MKKNVHVISHSHWDREWYMPFEHHRYRLVELFDDVIEACENDPDFKYYHLDGQVIPIYDYLEVKPHNRERLLKLIQNNQIQIGPWYLLQDEFLTSAESNVRNMLLGIKHSKLLGADPVMIGYFPDSFGNISQAPQILKKFGIETAAFGRGLNEVGFDNQIVKQDGLNKSELIWESPDGSKVVAILFTNWYCNANDLPLDEASIKERFESIIANAERFSLTNDLLALNGCDHTPVQKEISQIVKKAQKMFPNYNIIHSNFKDYIDLVHKYKETFRIHTGEIIGQLTTGYNLLNNTASTRIDNKMLNYKAQMTLERESEPIQALGLYHGLKYDKDYLDHSWLKLIENHPHDSICSCNCDEVNELVHTRLNETIHAAQIVRNEGVDRLIRGLKVESDDPQDKRVLVYNKFPQKLTTQASAKVYFPKELKVLGVKVLDTNGKELPVTFKVTRNVFTYTLPKNSFRRVTYYDEVKVKFIAKNLPGLGFKQFKVVPLFEEMEQTKTKNSKILENKFIKVKFNLDGTYQYTHKRSGKTVDNLNMYEYQADVGNEYNFKQSIDGVIRTTQGLKAKFSQHISNDLYQELSYTIDFKVPAGINGEYVKDEEVVTKITTRVRLYHHETMLRIKTTFDNQAENARYRALFNPNITTDHVLSEGQFDLIKRPLKKWAGWTNPVKTDRYYNFFALEDSKAGALVSGRGLHEYEILDDKVMALTLLKGVDEMGDWGIFPTPLSQMKGIYSVKYVVDFYDISDKLEAYHNAYLFQAGKPVTKDLLYGDKLKIDSFENLVVDNPNIIFSTFKKAENDDNLILRLYNISEEMQLATVKLNKLIKEVELVNLNEDFINKLDLSNNKVEVKFNPKEIVTIKLVRKDQ